MRVSVLILVALVALGGAGIAQAGGVIDRVKKEGVVHCGGMEQPGLAMTGDAGKVTGLNVDLCRAIAVAVLGPDGRADFHTYGFVSDETSMFNHDLVRDGTDEVAFLTGSQVFDAKLAGKLVPGPTVFYDSTNVIVPANFPGDRFKDLAGAKVCFVIGSSAHRAMEAQLDAQKIDFQRFKFSEYGEMEDAYNVQHCQAMVDEVTALAQLRLEPGINHLVSKILPEPLSVFPIMAFTGTEDGQWAALVAWTLHSVIRSEIPETPWLAGGVAAIPVVAPELGLEAGWQQRVIAAVGTYGDIFRRNLGTDSPFKLDRGVNAQAADGGLFLAPYSE
ncbi:MAG: hypothetical protein P4M00_19735 [Azospirillaceae bacterium]|nr:hypothetical protein [Azospirillaceae bacterium]